MSDIHILEALEFHLRTALLEAGEKEIARQTKEFEEALRRRKNEIVCQIVDQLSIRVSQDFAQECIINIQMRGDRNA